MKCFDETGRLDTENWEVSAVYMAFIFRKDGQMRPPEPRAYRPDRRAKPEVIDLISNELKEKEGSEH